MALTPPAPAHRCAQCAQLKKQLDALGASPLSPGAGPAPMGLLEGMTRSVHETCCEWA